MQHKIKKAVFILFFFLLILPGLQFRLNIIKMVPLSGTYMYEARPELSWDSLVFEKCQHNYEQYVNDHLGFRELFLRCYNQIWFSFFNKLHARDVIMGKNYCLYEHNYIKAFTGQDFLGDTAIDQKLRKTKFVQEILAKKNVHLFLLFAPGKAGFFPENIPDKYLKNASTETNYKYYIKGCMKYGINYLDMNSYFSTLKHSALYPLFSNIGIHWTYYGMTIVYDTLIKYLGHLQGAPLPQMVIDSIRVSHKAMKNDDDIEQGINLLFPLPHPLLAYPCYHFRDVPGMRKPSVLTIGDSYWWPIFCEGFTASTFNGSSLWFYDQKAFYDDGRPEAQVAALNMQKEIEQHDIIMFEATEANYNKIDYGVIDQLYAIYMGKGDSIAERRNFEAEVKTTEEVIRNTPGWFEQVKEGAVQNNVPLDTMLRRNAIFMVMKKKNK